MAGNPYALDFGEISQAGQSAIQGGKAMSEMDTAALSRDAMKQQMQGQEIEQAKNKIDLSRKQEEENKKKVFRPLSTFSNFSEQSPELYKQFIGTAKQAGMIRTVGGIEGISQGDMDTLQEMAKKDDAMHDTAVNNMVHDYSHRIDRINKQMQDPKIVKDPEKMKALQDELKNQQDSLTKFVTAVDARELAKYKAQAEAQAAAFYAKIPGQKQLIEEKGKEARKTEDKKTQGRKEVKRTEGAGTKSNKAGANVMNLANPNNPKDVRSFDMSDPKDAAQAKQLMQKRWRKTGLAAPKDSNTGVAGMKDQEEEFDPKSGTIKPLKGKDQG